MAISVGLWTPPPEAITRSGAGVTKVRTAAATDRAVNAVAVATRSAGAPPRAASASTKAAP